MESYVDNYKCKKGILKNIVKDNSILLKIKETVIEINKAVINTYQFIKLFYLYSISKKKSIPDIDEQFIKLSFMVTCNKDSRGAPLKESNIQLKKEMDTFYNLFYSKTLTNSHKPKINKMSHIISYSITEMMTSFKNNLEMHFEKYIESFIKANFEDIDDKNVYKIRKDLIDNTYKSDNKYHIFIKKYRNKILPNVFEKSFHYDLAKNSMKYLPFAIYINTYLEKKGLAQFHCFPLRNNIVPKHITLDTTCLIELLLENGFAKYTKGKGTLNNSKNVIWDTYFKMDNKIFKKCSKEYQFDFTIITDGIGCSLRFKKIKQVKVKKDKFSLPYFDTIEPDILQKKKLVYIDPNKGNLIYCCDDKDTFFRYTQQQRIKETGRIRFQKIMKNYKEEHDIEKDETLISHENSKTTNFLKFQKYLKIKNKINEKLFKYYEEEFIRKLKLRLKINTIRSERKLINNLKNKYNNPTLIIGDGKVKSSMKYNMSSPTIGLTKLLNKNFECYYINEHRTSCLNYRTTDNNLIINKNLYKNNKKIHSVLVSKIQSSSGYLYKSYINRDKNSVLNMKKIVNLYLSGNERPYWYRKSTKLPK